MKKVLLAGALIFGVTALAKANNKSTAPSLRNRILDNVNAGNDSAATKEAFKQKVLKMNEAEVEILYKFMITYKGSRDFLPVDFRAELRNLNNKYNLW